MGAQALVADAASDARTDRGGKYLTFRLGNEEYGLEILKVREIIGLMPVTAVPRTPDFIRGVVNLRGKIIPVLDLRKKFGMGTVQDTEFTCIVVVDALGGNGSKHMGVLVDTVSEVIHIVDEEVEDAPDFGAALDTGFILGIAKCKAGVRILLNIEAVLAEPGVVDVLSITESNLAATGDDQEKED